MNILNKTCFIADASEKLGRAVSLNLAKQGAKLVLCYETKEKEDKSFLDSLNDIKASYKVVYSDLLTYETCQSVCDDIASDNNFKKIDAMFYNVTPEVKRQEVKTMPREMFKELVDNYIIKAFACTKVFADFMSKDGGVIVYRGSINDDKPTGIAGFNSMYYAAIKNLNREAALYYGYYKIRTVCLEIGALDKEDEEYHNDIATFYDGYEYKIPSGYVGTGDDFGSLISYLISDGCKYINGAEIRVDGGLLFQYIEAVMTIAAHERLKREGKE